MREFKVILDLAEDSDFCSSDLREAILEGIDKIGNYNLIHLEVEEE